MTATAKKQKPLKRHPSKLKKMSAYMILTLILISIVAVLFAFPLYWIITGSFKTGAAINSTTPEWWHSQWERNNGQSLVEGERAHLWPNLDEASRAMHWRSMSTRERSDMRREMSAADRDKLRKRFCSEQAGAVMSKETRKLRRDERQLLRQQITEFHVQLTGSGEGRAAYAAGASAR